MKNWCQIGVKTIFLVVYKKFRIRKALILQALRILTKQISTHLLTVLTKRVIVIA